MTRNLVAAILARIRTTKDSEASQWPHRPLFFLALVVGLLTTSVLVIQLLAGEKGPLAPTVAGVATIAAGRVWWIITPPDDEES